MENIFGRIVSTIRFHVVFSDGLVFVPYPTIFFVVGPIRPVPIGIVPVINTVIVGVSISTFNIIVLQRLGQSLAVLVSR